MWRKARCRVLQLGVCVLWPLMAISATQPPCSSVLAGLLYGSFSLHDLFPSWSSHCSWTLENPDPTKYSLYVRFHLLPALCATLSPTLVPLDHYLPNQSCGSGEEPEVVSLCPHDQPSMLLYFDKNFVQLCVSGRGFDNLLHFHLVEFLLVKHENSSRFTCGLLCRWWEECAHWGCEVTHTGCDCSDVAPLSTHHWNASVVSSGDEGLGEEDEHVMKSERSIDPPGLFQAQKGDITGADWSQWSHCSMTCGTGWQLRTRVCSSSPYGTLCSGLLRHSRPCNNTPACPVDGVWEDWSPWSLCSLTCGRGSHSRSRICVIPQDGGKACEGPEVQTKFCSRAPYPTVNTWNPWQSWSYCSHTCGLGLQRRLRVCLASSHQEKCDGPTEEERPCNEQKCPAPYEVCDDELLDSLTWMRTAPGDTFYNKCPSNATGSASRECLLSDHGFAHWAPPSFAQCVSHEYRYLHQSFATGISGLAVSVSPVVNWAVPLQLRERHEKGQSTHRGKGPSQVLQSLHQLMGHRNYYSGDLLFSVELLRRVSDAFRQAANSPTADDVQNYFQVVSLMLEVENNEKWEDIQQVAPGSQLLMQEIENFIHVVGRSQRNFQSVLVVTDNLMVTVQREPISAISTDINFPMKGRRGMKDWARASEDKIFIPKEVLSVSSEEAEDFVIGLVLYRTLGFILPVPHPLAVDSKVLSVTVRPQPTATEHSVVVQLSPLLNGTSEARCVIWDYGKMVPGQEKWDTESCQTLPPSQATHTHCICSRLSAYVVLAKQHSQQEAELPRTPSVPLMVGAVTSSCSLLLLVLVYVTFWRCIRSENSLILLSFSFSVLFSNVLILMDQSYTLTKELCALTAALLHFFFLSSFCWVLTETWHSYLCVTGRMKMCLMHKRFLCLGWGFPALVVIISVGFTRTRGYGTTTHCWLSLEGGLLYAFVGPAVVVVLVNVMVGIFIFNKLLSRDCDSHKSCQNRADQLPEPRVRLLLHCSRCAVLSGSNIDSSIATNITASLWSSCVVLPLLALSWMAAVLAVMEQHSFAFQVLFGVFDSVLGMAIFIVHCVLRKEVRHAVCGWAGFCRGSNETNQDSFRDEQVDFENDVDLTCHSVSGVFSRTDPLEAISMSSIQDVSGSSRQQLHVKNSGHEWRQGALECKFGWVQPKEPPTPEPGARSEGEYVNLPPGGLVCEDISLFPALQQGLDRDFHQNLVSLDSASLTSTYDIHRCGSSPQSCGHTHHNRGVSQRLGSADTSCSAGCLEERKRVRYAELDWEKVMHTRKRHQELYQELSSNRSAVDHSSSPSRDKSSSDDQHSLDSFQTVIFKPSSGGGEQNRCSSFWNAPSPVSSAEDFQTEV